MADPGYIMCKTLDDLENWKTNIKAKYGWSQLVQDSERILLMGTTIICYAEGII